MLLSSNADNKCKDVFAIIIAYNPEIERITDNVRAVAGQVERVVVYDNCSRNREEVAGLEGIANSSVIFNEVNSGLPVSLNAGCRLALESGARYALLLDQDSIVSDGMVASLLCCMQPGVGIASPQIVDRNKREGFAPSEAVVPIKRVITSGALVSLEAWEDVGGFDERIFVDWADYEFCANMREHGYEIVRDNRTMILHEMGRREYAFTLPTPKGGRPFYRTNHSALRLKDKARSWVIVEAKYGWSKVGREERAYITAIKLRDLMLERGRVQTLRAFAEGGKEGRELMRGSGVENG